MSGMPKEHNELYFDKLCRTQKSETVLSLIQASYHAEKSNPSDLRAEIAKRLEHAYSLFRDNIKGHDTGSGTYSGDMKQFESQYTIGHELCIWKDSKLHLNDIAIAVAENKITIRDYFDIFFLNYFQPVSGKIVHPLLQILCYLDNNNLKKIEKKDIPTALDVEANLENINALCSFLEGTNYFDYDGKSLTYVSQYPLTKVLDACNKKYIGPDGFIKAKVDLSSDENYAKYIISNKLPSIENDEQISYNVFGMHMTLKNTALTDGHVCIGWSYLGDLSSCKEKNDLYSLYDSKNPNHSPQKRGTNVGQVWMFINSLKIGDYVVFFDKGIAHFGKVMGEYEYRTDILNQDSDYVNNRKVEWFKDINYKDLPEEYRRTSLTRKSIWKLDSYKILIKQILLNQDIKQEEYEDVEYDYDYSIEQLSDILRDEVNKGSLNKETVSSIHLFGIKYGKLIKDKQYSVKEIINKSGINESYFAELNKGINLSKYIEVISDEKLILIDDDANKKEETKYFDYESPIKDGYNLIVYGTPGCGKSYYVENKLLKDLGINKKDNEKYIRTTFYQDYTNTDFVGQILPHVEKKEDGTDKVTYEFKPGPFTIALKRAIENPNENIALVIEELNRGSAASIFGDIFQLLDRDKNGVSEYSILNTNIIDYLNKEFEKKYVFGEIRIPGNMFIFATMNTCDQNVFTLDNAFKRRWKFKKLINEFKDDHRFKNKYIPGPKDKESVTWQDLVESINEYILVANDSFNSEDKQIGVYFVNETGMRDNVSDVSKPQEIEDFAYKFLEYLWDDVTKFDNKERWFDGDINSLDKLVEKYKTEGLAVFKDGVIKKKQ